MAVATGAVDAFSFLTGSVFASVMTGNLVLLGLGAARHEGTVAVHAGVALGAYLVAAGGGARTCRAGSLGAKAWSAGTLPTLLAEIALLGTAGTLELVVPQSSSTWLVLTALVLGSGAMGLQSAVNRAARAAPSTTYLTGSLTETVGTLATSGRLEWRSAMVFGAAIAGAAAGAALMCVQPCLAPFLATLLLLGSLGVLGWASLRPRVGSADA